MIDFNAFFKVSYGLYIVTSGNKEKNNGLIANAAFQVTAEPARFAVCCNKDNYSAGIIIDTKAFALSVLHQNASMDIIGTFGYKSGRDISKLNNVKCIYDKTGVPIVIQDCVSYMELELEDTFEVGTHYIFIGKVISAQVIDDENTPITYDFYRNVKRGFAPKNAPTYVDKSKIDTETTEKKEIKETKSYKCNVCGYIYSESSEEDFETLPDNWQCPICGVSKEEFTII
ncbi:MAG: flavin reductase [Bacteroidales bacterium]|nr:flavin reductase [Bacteroidales bacterium]